MTMDVAGFALLALLGLIGSAMFSGLETGVYCLSRVRLNLRATSEPADRSARLLRHELDSTSRTLATLLIGNNVFNYMGVFGLTALLQVYIESEIVVIALIALLFTPVLLVVAESLPKELFRVSADRLTYLYVWPLTITRWLFTITLAIPIVLVFDKAAARITGASPADAFGRDARSRIAALLKEGATLGVLTESQTKLIDRALTLREATVLEEMIPWRAVRYARADWRRPTLLTNIRTDPHAPLPGSEVLVAGGSHSGARLSPRWRWCRCR